MALVDPDIFAALEAGPKTAALPAPAACRTPERTQVMLQAGAAPGLLKRKGQGFALSRRGAAFPGVPGLAGMVRHHAVLYRDLTDPVAFLRARTTPELARFWPCVFDAVSVLHSTAWRWAPGVRGQQPRFRGSWPRPALPESGSTPTRAPQVTSAVTANRA